MSLLGGQVIGRCLAWSCLRRSRSSVARPGLRTRAASLATDRGADEWQRRLPLLVSFEGSGDQHAERFDSYDYSRCRRVFYSCVVSSFHAFLIRVDAWLATFVLATWGSAWRRAASSFTKPSITRCQVLLGWSQPGSWQGVLSRPILSHLTTVWFQKPLVAFVLPTSLCPIKPAM